MRSVMKAPSAPVTVRDARIEDTRRYKFLSPVFGGGVRVDGARKPFDPKTPLRVPSLRGQLRFWWRAVNPRGCRTVKELLDAETKVFGAASESSFEALDIAVTQQPPLPSSLSVMVPREKMKTLPGMEKLAYGAFPLRDPEGIAHGDLYQYTGEWEVCFRYGASVKDDVEAALWAFAHFGGLGGRTRRGFGAVEQCAPKLLDIAEGWKRWIDDRSRQRERVAWPTLHGDRQQCLAVCQKLFDTGREAQEHLLALLRKLRQEDLGRRPQAETRTGKPGRSYWPEADAIRALTGRAANAHQQRVTHVDAFPRSAFGMPIIVHFKDPGDPWDTTILPWVKGEKKGRLASPLVLRPHRNAQGRIEALALVLAHPPIEGVTLEGVRPSSRPPLRATVTQQEARGLSPLNVRGRVFTDPLLRYLQLVSTGQ
jgi:CRISPR-associated protein Cmr1